MCLFYFVVHLVVWNFSRNLSFVTFSYLSVVSVTPTSPSFDPSDMSQWFTDWSKTKSYPGFLPHSLSWDSVVGWWCLETLDSMFSRVLGVFVNLTVLHDGSLVRLRLDLWSTSGPKCESRRRCFTLVSTGRGFWEVERDLLRSGTTDDSNLFRNDWKGTLVLCWLVVSGNRRSGRVSDTDRWGCSRTCTLSEVRGRIPEVDVGPSSRRGGRVGDELGFPGLLFRLPGQS